MSAGAWGSSACDQLLLRCALHPPGSRSCLRALPLLWASKRGLKSQVPVSPGPQMGVWGHGGQWDWPKSKPPSTPQPHSAPFGFWGPPPPSPIPWVLHIVPHVSLCFLATSSPPEPGCAVSRVRVSDSPPGELTSFSQGPGA